MRLETKRKSLHLVGAVIPLLLIYVPWQAGLGALTAFSLLNAAIDIFKDRFAPLGKLYGFFFGDILRDHEKKGGFTGSTCFFTSLTIAYGAFVLMLAMPVQFLAVIYTGFLIGDAAAALAGQAFGKRVIYNNKTLEGSLALILVSFTATFWIIPDSLHLVLFASVLLAVVELLLTTLDDNFFAPLMVTAFFYAVVI